MCNQLDCVRDQCIIIRHGESFMNFKFGKNLNFVKFKNEWTLKVTSANSRKHVKTNETKYLQLFIFCFIQYPDHTAAAWSKMWNYSERWRHAKE